jgi:hypothetical protein
MKKILFVLLLLPVFSGFSQEEVTTQKQNELYLNTYNLIAFKWFDVSYERVINDESSVGISTLIALDKESYGYDSYRNYSITPYYRHYFSNAYAQGFFMEAFTMLSGGQKEYYNYYYDDNTGNYIDESGASDYTDVAFGISIGGKFVSKRGFSGVIYAGVGRNLFDDNAPEVVGRGGISFGFRF